MTYSITLRPEKQRRRGINTYVENKKNKEKDKYLFAYNNIIYMLQP